MGFSQFEPADQMGFHCVDFTLLLPFESQVRITADYTSPGKSRLIGTVCDLLDSFGDICQILIVLVDEYLAFRAAHIVV